MIHMHKLLIANCASAASQPAPQVAQCIKVSATISCNYLSCGWVDHYFFFAGSQNHLHRSLCARRTLFVCKFCVKRIPWGCRTSQLGIFRHHLPKRVPYELLAGQPCFWQLSLKIVGSRGLILTKHLHLQKHIMAHARTVYVFIRSTFNILFK